MRGSSATDTEPERAPSSAPDRREQALLLVEAGRTDEAFALLQAELESGQEGVAWMTKAVIQAMQAHALDPAGDLAAVFTAVRCGPRPSSTSDGVPSAAGLAPPPTLSRGKLRHDIDQFRYLRAAGALGAEVDPVIADFEAVEARFAARGPEARMPLEWAPEDGVRRLYGCVSHVRPTPRLERALSDHWNRAQVERSYLSRAPGLVVIDDLLVPEALENLHRFCLESTVWTANRYPNGRLGSFFLTGFNCPLLLQIAEELRVALPNVIGDRHPLRQLWGFKYPAALPADSTIHADFAAVNVNFWITPDEANLDASSGGLVVYEIDAPASWDFSSYNERLDMIKEFLARHRPRVIRIPYRANRAVIFNSDLFHATDELRFRPDYEHRRVNITMLYGVREQDRHHPGLAAGLEPGAMGARASWRSPALTRARRSGRR